MNAPLIWFILPILVAIGLFLIQNDKTVSILAGFFSLILAIFAILLPPNTPISFLSISIKIEPSLSFFGRVFTLNNSDQWLLCFMYSFGSFWSFCTLAYNDTRKTVSMNLAILAIMVGALSVEPFLYSAVLMQIAALIAIPTLIRQGKKHGMGLVRFLINQTLGLPFILLAGFLLSGVEAGPDNLAIVLQAMLMLGLGFAFLLSVFPFYSWAPMLSEEVEPYKLSFILLSFPLITLLIGLDFIEKYSWLRNSSILFDLLRNVGLILILSASVWAAFQDHLGRIFAFSLVASTGYSLIAFSPANHIVGLESVFLLILPNVVTFGLWAYALNLIDEKTGGLKSKDVAGLASRFPFLSAGIAAASLTVAGLPLFAMFPIKYSIWTTLSIQEPTSGFLFGISFIGFFIAATRTFSFLLVSENSTGWKSEETQSEKFTILILIALLFLFGIFPSILAPTLDQLNGMFPNLTQIK